MTAWLLTGVAFAVLWTLWGFFNFVADLFESHRKAANSTARTRKRMKGRDQFS